MADKNCRCCLNIMELLRSVQHIFEGRLEAGGRQQGIGAMQMMILYEIMANQGITLVELCERLEMPKSSISRAVDGLVIKGMVKREIPEDNRRIVRLTVKETQETVAALESTREVMEAIPDGKRTRIMNALIELKDALNDIGG